MAEEGARVETPGKALPGGRERGRLEVRRALIAAVAGCALLVAVAPAGAAVGPVPDVKATWSDTLLPPGGEGLFSLRMRNVGDEDFGAAVTLEDHLPAGVTATDIRSFPVNFKEIFATSGADLEFSSFCTGVGTSVVSCEFPLETELESESGETAMVPVASLFGKAPGTKYATGSPFEDTGYSPTPTGWLPAIYVDVAVAPGAAGTATNTASMSVPGGALAATDVDPVSFAPQNAGFGIVAGSYLADVFDGSYPFGSPQRQAGSHPREYRLAFDFNAHTYEGFNQKELIGAASKANGLARVVETTLPRGMIGNPEALPKCAAADFAREGATKNGAKCASDTQVGYLTASVGFGGERGTLAEIPLYNIVPPPGTPVDLGFFGGGLLQGHIYASLTPSGGYRIKAVTTEVGQLLRVLGVEATIWGVPGDPVHDRYRFYPTEQSNGDVSGAPFTAPIRPFFTLPMDCGFANGATELRADSYEDPGNFTPTLASDSELNVEGCDDPRFSFAPQLDLTPSSPVAGGPSGISASLRVPQRDDEVSSASQLYSDSSAPQAIATPPLKKAVVTLPEGVTVSPSSAQGLGGCSPGQVGIGDTSPVACPEDSYLGKILVHTPILPADEPAEGRVYLASQGNNYFHNLLTIYLAVEEPERGLQVKVPGRIDLDPATGRITTTFDDLPQFPISEVEMQLRDGPRAGLVNPPGCGVVGKTVARLYSWQDPDTAHVVEAPYRVTEGPEGKPCPADAAARPFQPRLGAGTLDPLSGGFSPLEVDVSRSDAEQQISTIEASPPPGLVASLRGVARCGEAQIAAAASPARTGAEEIAAPSCPLASQVGTVDVGAGVGSLLTYVRGRVYLAGPYRGAPLSGVTIVPAVTGPFDLGVVVSRAPVYVNPVTARITLRTDPLPQVLAGVPVRTRDVRVHLNRPNFIVNPTSCEPFSFDAAFGSAEGRLSTAASPYQAASCGRLGFRPHLSITLAGKTKRRGHPRLRAVLWPRAGDANLASASVKLLPSTIIDQAHIRTICTNVQFAAGACPPQSIYGHAVAYSSLLDEPLAGPVYLRSSQHKLPDMVLDLHGIIDVQAVGTIDSVHGAIRSTFEATPDAPLSRVVLTMQGGRKGLIYNTKDLCEGHFKRGRAKLTAHNGRAAVLHPKVKATCGKRKKAAKRRHRRHHRGGAHRRSDASS